MKLVFEKKKTGRKFHRTRRTSAGGWPWSLSSSDCGFSILFPHLIPPQPFFLGLPRLSSAHVSSSWHRFEGAPWSAFRRGFSAARHPHCSRGPTASSGDLTAAVSKPPSPPPSRAPRQNGPTGRSKPEPTLTWSEHAGSQRYG